MDQTPCLGMESKKTNRERDPTPGAGLLFIPDPGGGCFVKQIMNFKLFINSKSCFYILRQ